MSDQKKTKCLVEGGHEFVLNEDGDIEYYDTPGYHGGPQCGLCHDFECQHCTPEFLTAKCPAKEFATLPGLEYD